MERTWSYCLGVHVVSTHSRAPAAPASGRPWWARFPSPALSFLGPSCLLSVGSALWELSLLQPLGTPYNVAVTWLEPQD